MPNYHFFQSIWKRMIRPFWNVPKEDPGALPDRLTLTVQEYAVLERFYNAQRPHDHAKTWRELRAEGHEPVSYEPMNAKCVCEMWNDTYSDAPLKYVEAKSE